MEHRTDLLCRDEVYAVMGAVFAVYDELGFGFLEAVYHEALAVEFTERKIPFVSQAPLRIRYKQAFLSKAYQADFVAFESVLVELKAADRLTTVDEAQLLNYLKATGLRVGLLVNFGQPHGVGWKRMVL